MCQDILPRLPILPKRKLRNDCRKGGVFGYDFAVIIQRKKGQCAATLAALFSIMFAPSITVGGEFYEFLMDTLHGTNLQFARYGQETAMIDISKYRGEYGYLGLVDTMTDMMNACGGMCGVVFMIVLRNRKKKNQPVQTQTEKEKV